MSVALVTGGQQGIGLGIAEVLLRAGFSVAIAANVAAESESVAEVLARLGPHARYYAHDVTEIDLAAALLDRIEDDLGPVTTLVSNAGVPAKVRGDLLAMAADSFDLVHAVNLRGAFFLAQEVARRMLALPAEPYRALVFVTSASAELVSADRAEYCISKAGAAMMAQCFAVRLAPHGIGVFDVRPGIIETAMTAAVKDRYTARIEAGLVPAGRWGTTEDVARAVLPLVTGAFRFATGAVVPVGGGLSIPRL